MSQTVNKIVARVFTAVQGKTEDLAKFNQRRLATANDITFYTKDVKQKGRTVHETVRQALKRMSDELETSLTIVSIEERTFSASY